MGKGKKIYLKGRRRIHVKEKYGKIWTKRVKYIQKLGKNKDRKSTRSKYKRENKFLIPKSRLLPNKIDNLELEKGS
jgi:hypothetical protein